MSEPFQVFPPISFPGVTGIFGIFYTIEPTELTKCLSQQGVRMQIRSTDR